MSKIHALNRLNERLNDLIARHGHLKVIHTPFNQLGQISAE